MRYAFLPLFLATLAMTGFAAAADSDPQPIKIGLTCPFSGGSSPMGISLRNSVRLAVAEINWKGGLLGRQIELIERDDEANPAKGKLIAEELVKKEKVVATIGNCNTGVTLDTIHFYQQAKIPVIVPVATGVAITRKFLPPEHPESYVFRTSANDDIQAEQVVREAVEKRKLKKLAIFHDTTAYGMQGKEFVEKALAKRGLKAAAVVSFPLGVTDLTAQLERARRAGADAIISYTVGPEAAAIANSRAQIDWKAPVVGSWPLSWENFLGAAAANAEGVRMPQTFFEELTTSRRTAFITSYLTTYKLNRISSAISAAQGYDSMLILAAAIKQAGTTDGPKIRAALENLRERIYGVITTYDRPFTPNDHEAITSNMVAMGEVRDGVIVYAYKDEQKAGLTARKKSQ